MRVVNDCRVDMCKYGRIDCGKISTNERREPQEGYRSFGRLMGMKTGIEIAARSRQLLFLS
jgi:hypothetical protein